jgi:hypothetical protein
LQKIFALIVSGIAEMVINLIAGSATQLRIYMKIQNTDRSSRGYLFVSAAVAAVLAGCAFIESHSNSSSQPGVSYYLPMRPVKLIFLRTAKLVNGKCEQIDQLEAVPSALVADASKRYIIALNHHAFRTDSLVVTTTASGLLKTSNAIAVDNTAAILAALASSQAAMATIGSTRGTALKTTRAIVPGTMDCSSMNAKVEQTLNPASEKQLGAFVNEMKSTLGTNGYALSLKPLVGASEIDIPRANETRSSFPGLAYRRSQPQLLTLTKGASTLQSLILDLPQGAPIEMLVLKASVGNTVTLNSVFEDGMLTSHTDMRPSEALAIAGIPFEVAKAALAVPAALLTLRLANVTKDNELAAALRAQICAQEKLSAAQEARPVNAALCIVP